jgi:hypothetical protein
VVLGDVNGDGIADIVTANAVSDNVSVLTGKGDGTFNAKTDFAAGDGPFSVVLGDVNGDGIADIVTANLNSDNVSVLTGNGDGTFNAKTDFTAGDGPRSVVLGDVNGDGIDDIVTANLLSVNVSVLTGKGDGTFNAKTDFAAGNRPASAVLGDVNGDGIDDIVTANAVSDNVSVLTGKGDGTFNAKPDFAAGNGPRSVVLGDVNGDGIDDIVTANAGSDNVSVLTGKSSITDVLAVESTLVIGNSTNIRVRNGNVFQPLLISDVNSSFGTLRRTRDFEFLRLAEFENKLLATVRLTDNTARPGELQLLLIDAPQFDQEGNILPSTVENLTLDSSLRLTATDSDMLFVDGNRIYLTAEIVGAAIGTELLTFNSEDGLRQVGDLLPGADSSQAQDFVATATHVYFTALAERTDNTTRQPVTRREVFELDPADNSVRAVRAGQAVTGPLSLVGQTLLFNSAVNVGETPQLLQYDTNPGNTNNDVSPSGAFVPFTGDVAGTVFLDRNSDGRQNEGEPGRAGVILYVDENNNGRREAVEPFTTTRQDDPATPDDEAGQYAFFDLVPLDGAAPVIIREVPQAGFTQTTPLQVQPTEPVLTLIRTATPVPGNAGLGLPSVVGDSVVFVDHTSGSGELLQNDVPVSVSIPGETIQSLGASHAQDGSSIVFTTTLADAGSSELVLLRDDRDELRIVADTRTPILSQPIGAFASSTTLTDITDGRNGGFDSLSLADGNVGFIASSTSSIDQYYLGDFSGERFAEFSHGQVILEGDNEIFVDRIVEATGAILTGPELFLDKATLDVQVGGNTGWRIRTRTGEDILPLTFYDRIYDVSVSGQTAVFRALDANGNTAIYTASPDRSVRRLIDIDVTLIPDDDDEDSLFSTFGSIQNATGSPSVAVDGENILFLGGGDIPISNSPVDLVPGDVDGDGVLDLIVARTGGILIADGDGGGTFLESPATHDVGNAQTPVAVAAGDRSGNSVIDLIVAVSLGNSDQVSVFLASGGGDFAAAVNYSLMSDDDPASVALGDVTGDNILDIVTANQVSGSVSVLAGNSDGTFGMPVRTPLGSELFDLVLGDVTGDAQLDIVTAGIGNVTPGKVNILESNGDGSFQMPVSIDLTGLPEAVTLGDINGDGIQDIVTANTTQSTVSVLISQGSGAFAAAQSFSTGEAPGSVAIADLNGDNNADIVTASRTAETVNVLPGDGLGAFPTVAAFGVGIEPESVALADIDGDGHLDIITANKNSNDATLLTGDSNNNFQRFPALLGLYAQIGQSGALRRIVDRTTFDGRTDVPGETLTDLSISHDAISGGRIVFHATFSGGTEAVYQADLDTEPLASLTVIPGQAVSGVLFGSSALPGSIRGVSFTDTSLDGTRNAGEVANAGRTVFLDENLNGLPDPSEIQTVTNEDGEFVFSDLVSERTYVVREELPLDRSVTFPQTLTQATVQLGAGGTVEFNLGSVDSGALGNSADGVVQGVVFDDKDGNGVRGDSSAEPGIPNLTVFVDENGDGVLNGGERSSQTTADGSYTIDQLRGTLQAVRVVLPGATTDQTSPLGNTFTKSTLRTVDSPVEVITGDFNGDGIDDIATTINQASEVRLFLNDGSGGFVAGESLEVSGGPGSIEVGRFLGPDGGDGLVVGHRTTSSVKVLTRQSDGAFSTLDLITPQDVQAGGQFAGFGNAPFIVTTGDFNSDGNDDIAVVSQNALPAGGAVAVFLSDGDGTFTHEQTLTLPQVDADFPTAITAGLINAGGTVDLAISNLGTANVTANVTILSNSGVAGSSRFSIDQHLPVLGRAPSSVQLGDLDGDGDNEIVTTNLLSNNVSVFDNNGDGTFGTATILSAGRGPAFAELIDLDQNGSLDIAFSNSDAGNRFGILRNRGDGTFLAAEASGLALLSDGTLAFSLAIGRFDDDNGDGVINDLDTPDVVVSNRSGESLNAGVGSLTVGLNAIVPGALSVELPTDTRTADGLNFGLRTINLPPTIATPADPEAIDEDADQQTVVLTGITTGGESETLQVSVASDNASLIVPTVTFDSEAGTATVRYTPADDQSGSARITVAVRDAGIDGSFNAIDPDSDDGVATASFNVVVNPVNDLPPADADTFGVLLENGATVLNVLANDNDANPDTGEPLTILFTGQPAAGGVTIVNGGQQLQYTPAAGFIGQETFSYIVSDNQFTAQGSVTVNVTSNVTPSDLLTVSSFTPNPSGFAVIFSEAFNASMLNLYATQSLGPADIVVTGTATGVVSGSLITDAAAGSATFIKTGEQLAPDTYTVTIRSASDSFVTGDGDLLDGDSNGTGGDDFTTVFTVAPLSPETVTVSLPDFARGFGQAVNIPADGVGIPLTISRGTGISSLTLQLSYDSSLLAVTEFTPLLSDTFVDFVSETGVLSFSRTSEFTSDPGTLTIGYFTASVPDAAIYRSKQIVEIVALNVFSDAMPPALLPAVADSAIHVAAFPGDEGGNRRYDNADGTLALRQSSGRIDGLASFPLADPSLISDVTFNGNIGPDDVTDVQRLITGLALPQVPSIPSDIDPLPAIGADPILSIPQNLTGRLGQTITVPVQLEVTEASGITVSGLDVAVSYDATQFSVGNVRVGSLLTDNSLSPFSAFANIATPGQLLVTASSAVGTSQLAQGATGDVFLIDFTVLPTAAGGPSVINLLSNAGGLLTGIADNDLSELILSPAPTNATNDSVDGLFTITTDVTLVEQTEAGQLIVRDASPSGLNNQLAFSINAGVLIITESVLPILAAFGQQISDQEVRVTLAELSTLTVDVQLLAGNDSADGSVLSASVSLNLAGGPGNDTLTGGSQNDTLSGGLGDDDLDGGGGTDVLTITQDGHLSITTTQTLGQGTDTFANIEQAVLEGGSRNNRLDASQATIPVTLLGQSGNDTLSGGSAADVLDGGAGIDFAEVFGSNIILTNASAPGAGAETLIALEGLLLIASARGSSIDASGYTLGPVIIIGSSGDDTLKGGPADDLILARAGKDSIDGGGGADLIAGGPGRDTINGNDGNDTIFGGGGRDEIDGAADSDLLVGGGGNDTIRGGDGADRVFGSGGRDRLDGDDGADTLLGGAGPDNIAGGQGDDRLNGVDRDDTFTFNQVVGQDTLFGGNRVSARSVQFRPAETPKFHLPPASVTADDVSIVPTSSDSVSRPHELDSTMEIDTAFSAPLLAELLEL